MALVPGTRVGPYAVTAQIGVGGMGEVYRATDTNLGREVALKVLPDAVAHDAERVARFDREARTLAALNHPNIAAIHGLERTTGVTALVMELVEGPTLAERIAHGQVPRDEALPIATQIAEALEAAHELGIVHRDLKPANIKVRPDGTVKVLDFGLAKAMEPAAAAQTTVSQLPTITTPALVTGAGMILGTAAYMSPEQARGRPVDTRTDIWAFGCVFYEMLAGRRAFSGDDITDVLAAVVRAEPDWTALPADLSPGLALVLRRCLAKDPKQRIHHIADVRLALAGAFDGASMTAVTAPASRSRGSLVLAWSVAGVALFAAIGLAVRGPSRTNAGVPVVRASIDVAPAEQVSGASPNERRTEDGRQPSRTALALSPDGRMLAFGGTQQGIQRLFVRALDRPNAAPLDGTDGGEAPFFSPDGQWIGFWADGLLKRVPAAGGPPLTIVATPEPTGASWGPRDTIVFGGIFSRGILQVSAAGGTPTEVTRLRDGEFMHKTPSFLPDGRAILFTVQKADRQWDDASIVLQSLDTGDRRVLVDRGSDARYIPSGHLTFMRDATLMVVPFDLSRLEVSGSPVGVQSGVMHGLNPRSGILDTGAGQYALSNSGSLAYVAGAVVAPPGNRLVWFDRRGRATPLPGPIRPYAQERLSPDERQIAFAVQESNRRVWLYDVARGTARPLYRDGPGAIPLFSPDGSRVVFTSESGGAGNLYWMPADGNSQPERLTTSATQDYANSFSPDGRTLLFTQGIRGEQGVFVLDLASGDTRPLANAPAVRERHATFSPDGRWILFTSDESGRDEIYLQPYPGPGPRVQVSIDGGTSPAWNANGREAFFVREVDARQGRVQMFAVDVMLSARVQLGRPRLLFEATAAGGFVGAQMRGYDVSRDGQRFLTGLTVENPEPPPATRIEIVTNWFEELKRLAPTK